jgi:glycosyltransferase involved in cell wall biosynthesis
MKTQTKKIIYISWGNIPNAAANTLQVIQMCKAFAQLGYDVTVLTSCSLFDFFSAAEKTRIHYGLDNLVRVVAIPNRYQKKKSDRKIERILYRVGVRLYLLFSINNNTIVYSRNIGFVLEGLKRNVYSIWETHKEVHPNHKNLLQPYRENTYIVTISEYLARQIKNQVNNTIKVLVAEDGVEYEHYQKAAPLNLNRFFKQNQPVVTYCGSLGENRGIELIVKFAKNNPSINCLIIGGTEDQKSNYITDKECPENLVFLGFIRSVNVPAYLKGSDLLLMPYSDKIFSRDYMSPLKLYEYMGSGVPVVSSDLPILKKIVENGKNGYLFIADDYIDFELTVKNTLNEGESKKNLIINNALQIAKENSWKKRAEKIIDTI